MSEFKTVSSWIFKNSLLSAKGILILVLILTIFVLTLINVKTIPKKRVKFLVVSSKVLTLIFLFLFFLEPVRVIKKISLKNIHDAVIVDTSESMNFKNKDGKQRSEIALNILNSAFQNQNTDFFDLNLKKLKSVKGLKFNLKKSEIVNKTAQFLDENSIKYDTFWIFSDLQDNSSDPDFEKLVRSLKKAGSLRVVFVKTGEVVSKPDVFIEKVFFDPIGFYKNIVNVSVIVKGVNFKGKVKVKVSGGVFGVFSNSKVFELSGGEEKEYKFQYRPEKLGDNFLVFKCSVVDGSFTETNLENNIYFVKQRIIRDRIRVLHLAGHPSWDVKFLRNYLKKEENIDLISFYIMVRPSSYFYTDLSRTVLIPFPTKKLFVDELMGFDLIIFQNFRFGAFDTDRYAKHIVDFVKKGGACLIIGGEQTFLSKDLISTELKNLFPSTIPTVLTLKNMFEFEKFTPQVSDMYNELVLYLNRKYDLSDIFGKLPKIEGINIQGSLKKGAKVVFKTKEKGLALLTTMDLGKGRVLFFATDSLWLYRFRSGITGYGKNFYNDFLRGMIKYLLRDPDVNSINIKISPKTPHTGETVYIEPEINLGKQKGSKNIVWNVTIFDPIRKVTTKISKPLNKLVWHPEKEGVFFVNAEAKIEGATLKGSKPVLVVKDKLELQEPSKNYKKLLKVLKKNGVKVISPAQLPDFKNKKIKGNLTEVKKEKPYLNPYLLLFIVFLIGLEWFLRSGYGN